MDDHGVEDVAGCHIDKAKEEAEGEGGGEMGDDKAGTAIDYVIGDVDEGKSQAGSDDCGEVSHPPVFESRDQHAPKDEFFKDCRTKNHRCKKDTLLLPGSH